MFNHLHSQHELNESIQLLEEKQKEVGEMLIAEIIGFTDQYKPINIFKTIKNDLFTSRDIEEDILNSSLDILDQFVYKIKSDKPSDSFKNILLSLLEVGLGSIVVKNGAVIKSLIKLGIKKIL